jgi:multidrug transporter EmrE-like cation transporter
MTVPDPPPDRAPEPAGAPAVDLSVPRPRRRQLWLGIAVGVLVPLLSFLPLTRHVGSLELTIARNLWAAVAFVAVLLLFPRRFRRYGVGMLIGFCALLICGAGTCMVVVLALEGG